MELKELKEIQNMQSFIDTQCTEQPEEVVYRINVLNAYLSRSGMLLANAKREQDKAVRRETESANLALPASAINAYIKSRCSDENYIVNWLDRMNRTITHQIDALRSILSYEKEQLKKL